MELLSLSSDGLPAADLLIVALDGWTDAGQGGTGAAKLLLSQYGSDLVASFDPDAIYDYRDRRPTLPINRGVLGDPVWPSLDLHAVALPGGQDALVLVGGEPDFGWQALGRDLVHVVHLTGIAQYIGLGSVPGPVPHTRPIRVITTSSSEDELERFGRPHEQVVVPASFQVIVESTMRDAGFDTLGFWARVPHYVATDYPEAARALLSKLGEVLAAPIDTTELDESIDEQRDRLAVATQGSDEVAQHIEQLEELYDADAEDNGIDLADIGDLPTGDELAEEFERFLRGRDD